MYYSPHSRVVPANTTCSKRTVSHKPNDTSQNMSRTFMYDVLTARKTFLDSEIKKLGDTVDDAKVMKLLCLERDEIVAHLDVMYDVIYGEGVTSENDKIRVTRAIIYMQDLVRDSPPSAV